jgi:N-acylglucosamine 2-epimerase
VGWFLIHLCKLNHGTPEAASCMKMALEAIEGSLVLGWDAQYGGGILYMMDVLDKPIADATVTATNKLWWPHAEALYALTLAYTETRDARFLGWLERVHAYVYEHFVDSVERGGHGEWYGYLDRQGAVFNRCKGGNYKGCFHVPRALLFSYQTAAAFLSAENPT